MDYPWASARHQFILEGLARTRPMRRSWVHLLALRETPKEKAMACDRIVALP
jgi:hypothetical protein